MTELEAYKRLGWKTDGDLAFQLPASDTLAREDWCMTKCEPCCWTGISVPACLEEGCPSCGKPWTTIIK